MGSTPGWHSPGIRRCRHAALLLLAGGLILECLRPISTGSFSSWFWPAAAICTVLELTLSLPLQNAIAASLQTAGIAWLLALGGRHLGIYLDLTPPGALQLPGEVGASFVASWTGLSPCFRTLARAMLSPRRGGPRFGLEVLGVTVLLSAGTVWWLQAAAAAHDWRGIFLWICTAAMLHGANTPWLLNKRPARESSGIGSLALPSLMGIGMMRSLQGSAPREAQAVAGLILLTVLALAWRGTAPTR